ncbi:hypothetical protein [Oerskovia flava]|uniref:hypothetical protein n=1 Tax=Oerskovia flava TaxID=2986422 RepID=UPI002AD5652D|nr:hypothetical protein [Oerskovia sp. JB1-3-2]
MTHDQDPPDDTQRDDTSGDDVHGDRAHGPAPLPPVDATPLHAAVDALTASLHDYVETAVGVRAEFGAAEADEDPRVLALENTVGVLNAKLFDTLHGALGMHPDLTTSVWEPDAAEGGPGASVAPAGTAEAFYLGFVVAASPAGPADGTSDWSMDSVIDLLDEAGEGVVQRLVDAGLDVVEWAASRGDAADFDTDPPGDTDEEDLS